MLGCPLHVFLYWFYGPGMSQGLGSRFRKLQGVGSARLQLVNLGSGSYGDLNNRIPQACLL